MGRREELKPHVGTLKKMKPIARETFTRIPRNAIKPAALKPATK